MKVTVLRMLMVCLLGSCFQALGAEPAWWGAPGVKNGNPANDQAVATVGQVMHLAKHAAAAMNQIYGTKLAAGQTGAGTEIQNNLTAHATRLSLQGDIANRKAITLGQLKTISAPYWKRLMELGVWPPLSAQGTSPLAGNALQYPYPWTNSATDDDQTSLAALGQVKQVFAFHLLTPDSNGNGIYDGWEYRHGLFSGTVLPDADEDGLSNLQEYQKGTDPRSPDSDNDGIEDLVESQAGSPTKANQYDTDGDGMGDDWELQYGLNPANAADAALDTDGDGWTNLQEFQNLTDPTNPDSDGDGWEDGEDDDPRNPYDPGADHDNDHLPTRFEIEVAQAATKAINALGQGATVPPGLAALALLDPRNGADTDLDGIPDDWERVWDFSPSAWNDHQRKDSDSDGLSDLNEYMERTWPKSKASTFLPLVEPWLTRGPDYGSTFFFTNRTNVLHLLDPLTGEAAVLPDLAPFDLDAVAFDEASDAVFCLENTDASTKLARCAFRNTGDKWSTVGVLMDSPATGLSVDLRPLHLLSFEGKLYYIRRSAVPAEKDDLIQITLDAGSTEIVSQTKIADLNGNADWGDVTGATLTDEGWMYFNTGTQLRKYNLRTQAGGSVVSSTFAPHRALLWDRRQNLLYGSPAANGTQINSIALSDGTRGSLVANSLGLTLYSFASGNHSPDDSTPLVYQVQPDQMGFAHGVNPDSRDSDGDDYLDGYEVLVGKNPRLRDDDRNLPDDDPVPPEAEQLQPFIGGILPWSPSQQGFYNLNGYLASSSLFQREPLEHWDPDPDEFLLTAQGIPTETIYDLAPKGSGWEVNLTRKEFQGSYFPYYASSSVTGVFTSGFSPEQTFARWNILSPAGRNFPLHPGLGSRVLTAHHDDNGDRHFGVGNYYPFHTRHGRHFRPLLSIDRSEVPGVPLLVSRPKVINGKNVGGAGWDFYNGNPANGEAVGAITVSAKEDLLVVTMLTPTLAEERGGEWTGWSGNAYDPQSTDQWQIGLGIPNHVAMQYLSEEDQPVQKFRVFYSGGIELWATTSAQVTFKWNSGRILELSDDVIAWTAVARPGIVGGRVWTSIEYSPYQRRLDVASTLLPDVQEAPDMLVSRPLVLRRGSPPRDDAMRYRLDISEDSGHEYRKIGLNGLPLADSKPEHSSFMDEISGGTYVDALNLNLRHSVRDVQVPVEGASVDLGVTRVLTEEIFTNHANSLKPFANSNYGTVGKPFGACWHTGLTPYVRIDIDNFKKGTEPIYATVVDEGGNSHRFAMVASGNTSAFIPLYSPADSGSKANSLSIQTQVPSVLPASWSGLTFRRHTGVTVRYQFAGMAITKPFTMVNNVLVEDQNAATWQRNYFYRVISNPGGTEWGVEDQTGARLYYHYGISALDPLNQTPGQPTAAAVLLPDWISDIPGGVARKLKIDTASTFRDAGTGFPMGTHSDPAVENQRQSLRQQFITRVQVVQNDNLVLRQVRYNYRMLDSSSVEPDGSQVLPFLEIGIPRFNQAYSPLMVVLDNVQQAVSTNNYIPKVGYHYRSYAEMDIDPGNPATATNANYYAHFWMDRIGQPDASTLTFESIRDRTVNTYTGFNPSYPEFTPKQGLPRVITAVIHRKPRIGGGEDRTVLSEFKVQESPEGSISGIEVHNKINDAYNSPAVIKGKRINLVVDADRRKRFYTFEQPVVADSANFQELLLNRGQSTTPLNRQATLCWTQMTIDHLNGAKEVYLYEPAAMMALKEARVELAGGQNSVTKWEYADRFHASHFCSLLSPALETHPFFPQYYPEPTATSKKVSGSDALDVLPPATGNGERYMVTKFKYWNSDTTFVPADSLKRYARARIRAEAMDGTVTQTQINTAPDGEGLPISETVKSASDVKLRETFYYYAAGNPPSYLGTAPNSHFINATPGKPWRLFRTDITDGVRTIDGARPLTTALWRDAFGYVTATATGGGQHPAPAAPDYITDTTYSYSQYDAIGQLQAKADGRAGAQPDLRTSPLATLFEYRLDGRLARTKGPLSDPFVSAWPSDQAGRPLTQVEYDVMGRRLREINAHSTSTWFSYNGLGQLICSFVDLDNSSAAGTEPAPTAADAVSRWFCTTSGLILQEQGPGAPITRHQYDWLRRKVQSITNPSEATHPSTATEVRLSYAGAWCGDSLFSSSGFKPTLIEGPHRFTDTGVLARKEFVYDSLYRLKQEKTEYNPGVFAVVSTGYDLMGNPRITVDPRGNSPATLTYDGLGRVIQELRADNSKVDTVYTPAGHAWKMVELVKTAGKPDDQRATYVFQDAAGRVSLTYLPRTSGDAAAQLQIPASSTPSNEQISYNEAGLVIWKSTLQSLSPTVRQVTMSEYDPAGRPWRVTAPQMTNAELSTPASVSPQTLTWYDLLGRTTKTVDPRGAAAETIYDKLGRAVQTVSSAVPVFTSTSLEAAPSKLEAPVFTSSRAVSLTTYDIAGRVERVITGHTLPGASANALIDQNAIETGSYPATGVVRNEYDGMGRLRLTKTRNGTNTWIAETFAYDEAGNRTSVTDGAGKPTVMTYDAMGRLLTTTHHGAAANTLNTYDGMLLLSTRRPDLSTVSYVYDIYSRLKQTTFSSNSGENTLRTWNSAGDLLSVVYSNPSAIAPSWLRDVYYTVDRRGRQTSETSIGCVQYYSYDEAGNRTQAAYGESGLVLTSTYDSHNRLSTLTERRDGAPANGNVTAYHYARGGQLIRKVLPDLTEEKNTLDALGRVVDTTTTKNSVQISRYKTGYDVRGNVGWISEERTAVAPAAPVNRRVRNIYDGLNRLTEQREFTSTQRTSTQWQYDNAGNRTATVFRQEAQPATAVLTPATPPPAWTLVWQEALTYGKDGAAGDLSFSGFSGNTFPVAYEANQLRRAIRTGPGGAVLTNTHYRYDARGNRAEQHQQTSSGSSAAAGPQSQQAQAQAQQQQAGNGAAAPAAAPAPVFTSKWTLLTWDPLDRLIMASVKTTGLQTWNWQYDYRSRRVLRQSSTGYEVSAFSGGTCVGQYTGLTLASVSPGAPASSIVAPPGSSASSLQASGASASTSSSTSSTTPRTTTGLWYVRGSDFGGGVGGVLYTVEGTTNTAPTYYEYGTRGDVTGLRTNSGLIFQSTYSAFGTHTDTGSAGRLKHRASTKEEETELGFLNEGFRYRDIQTGSFLSRDPAGFVDGPNLYAYVMQNPWSAFDPEGLDSYEMGDTWGFAKSLAKDTTLGFLNGFNSAFYGMTDAAYNLMASVPQAGVKGVNYVAEKGLGISSPALRATDELLESSKNPMINWGLVSPDNDMANVVRGNAEMVYGAALVAQGAPSAGEAALQLMQNAKRAIGAAKTRFVYGSNLDEFQTFMAARQTGYGTEGMSKIALEARVTFGIKENNIAVAEVLAQDGSLLNYWARSGPLQHTHAELQLMDRILAEGHDLSQVTRIYSELAPCRNPGAWCASRIQKLMPQAEVSWSFPYQGSSDAVSASQKILEAMKSYKP